MADLVREGGRVDEGELAVLEKSGVFANRKHKGKAKARSTGGPKHIVFVEEGEEGPSHLFSVVCAWYFILTMLLDTCEGPPSSSPVPKTAPSDELEIDLGWKPEGRQRRKRGKQKSHGQDGSDLQLLEEGSEVRCIPVPAKHFTDPEFRNTDGGWFRSFQLGWSGINSCVLLSESWRCRDCSWGKVGPRS